MVRVSAAVFGLVVVGFAAFAVHTSATSTVTPQNADVNKDGAVTIADAIAVLPHIGQLAPTPAPDGSRDVVINSGITVGDHQQAWFGAYVPATCPEAVLFVQASGGGTFDFLVAGSNDGVSPSGGYQNIGNSSNTGANGAWVTHRKLSVNQTGATGGNVQGADYNDEGVPYLLIGAFANQTTRFRAEVHCTRAWPS